MRRRHRRLDFAGSLHFVTTVTSARGNWFVSNETCKLILSTLETYRAKYEVETFGFVLMPDHLHALLRQNSDGSHVSDLMASFKRETAKSLPIRFRPGCEDLTRLGETLWRERYDDVPIPGLNAAMRRLEYMHSNPIRRGLVEQPTDYPWSSARFYYNLESHTIVTITRP